MARQPRTRDVKPRPRPPIVEATDTLAEEVEASLIHVPASGARIPAVENPGMKWRQEVAKPGSPYANMKPGQVLPGKRTPGLEGPPIRLPFRSKKEWRWAFWRRKADAKSRAHLRPWKTLPERAKRRRKK